MVVESVFFGWVLVVEVVGWCICFGEGDYVYGFFEF